MIEFRETQRPPKAVNVIIYIAMSMTVFVSILTTIATFATTPSPVWYDYVVPIVIILITPISIWFLFRSMRQTVSMNSTDIRVRQSPIHRKDRVFLWDDVSEVIYRPFSAFGEFGGWGIRYNMNGVWGYVIGGKHAIEIHLKDGRKRLFSVEDTAGARAALEQLQHERDIRVRFLTQR